MYPGCDYSAPNKRVAMFNPAYPFTQELLESFVKKEVVYFVKSTYPRGVNAEITEAFLISHYHVQSEAERHFNAIAKDVNRQIYDYRNLEEYKKLVQETIQEGKLRSFSKLIHPENEKKATSHFREHTKRYLFKNTNWDLTGRVTIYPKLRFQLGQLFVRISHEGSEIIVPFHDIENS